MLDEKLKKLEKKKINFPDTTPKTDELDEITPKKVKTPAKTPKELRKTAREAKREKRVDDVLSSESSKYGIDLTDLDKNPPLSEDDKVNYAEAVKKMTEKNNISARVQGLIDLYPKAPQERLPELDRKQLEESVRKQRKAKISDAFTAIGMGLQGKDIFPEMLKSNRIKNERDAQFKEYSDIAKKNQQTKQAWNIQNANRTIDFLEGEIKDKNTSEENRRIYQRELEAQKQKREAQHTYTMAEIKAREKAGASGRTPRSTSDVVLPYSMEPVLDAMADGKMTNAKFKRSQKQLIANLYDVTTENGKEVATPKQGMENAIQELQDKANQLNNLKQQYKNLQIQYEAALGKPTLTAPETLKSFEDKMDVLEKKLTRAQSEFQNIISGNQPEQENTTPSQDYQIPQNWQAPGNNEPEKTQSDATQSTGFDYSNLK